MNRNLLYSCVLLLACSPDAVDLAGDGGATGGGGAGSTTGAVPATSAAHSGSMTAADGTGTSSAVGDTQAGVSSDDGMATTASPPPDLPTVDCSPADLFDPVPTCRTGSPGPFEPEIVWTWSEGDDGDIVGSANAVVMNMTDDNGDGVIDLCDTPDVVVAAGPAGSAGPGRLYVIDGATGQTHFKIVEEIINPTVTPALGDLDGDGFPEIVAVSDGLFNGIGQLVVFNHDGTLLAKGDLQMGGMWHNAPSLADLDNDGDVEIVIDGYIYDHEANLLANVPGTSWGAVVVDLDGDGDMEIVRGRRAHHHDGEVVYDLGSSQTNDSLGYVSVANLDDDDDPEIVFTNTYGLTMLESDGTIVFENVTPTGEPTQPLYKLRRATSIGDFLGDGTATISQVTEGNASVYSTDMLLLWSNPEVDTDAVSTAGFDFHGIGRTQVVYQADAELKIMDDDAEILTQITVDLPSFNRNAIIVDADNDGSADIITSSGGSLHMISDATGSWVPARRVWNQYSYHITNIGEDGQVPQVELPFWNLHNTYRTQAQIRDGEVCLPIPAQSPT